MIYKYWYINRFYFITIYFICFFFYSKMRNVNWLSNDYYALQLDLIIVCTNYTRATTYKLLWRNQVIQGAYNARSCVYSLTRDSVYKFCRVYFLLSKRLFDSSARRFETLGCLIAQTPARFATLRNSPSCTPPRRYFFFSVASKRSHQIDRTRIVSQ